MTTIHIPPAALEAGARNAHADWQRHCSSQDGTPIGYYETWEDLPDDERDVWRNQTRAAFVAMVEAWPDMAHRVMPYSALILPLTENPDDKA